ncbi:MAG: 3-hydroxyacyl-ACP dehydratase FabZ family protein [Peptococcaceae bacterium]|nr:3-hydroxyacyl-ACP dehydratase FabZ family protein [Peptococcaceae bacterium]
MNQEAIKDILPHRDNMLLLDSVEQDGEWAVGSYTVRGDEWFLQGHFPGRPVVPGVILCEILAQSSCILLKDEMAAGKLPMYTGMNNVKFRAPVTPGDTFTTRCRIKRRMGQFYFAEGSGSVGETLCVKGEFSFAIVEA